MLLKRKCVREKPILGGNVKYARWHRIYNITTYDSFLSDSYSVKEDIISNQFDERLIWANICSSISYHRAMFVNSSANLWSQLGLIGWTEDCFPKWWWDILHMAMHVGDGFRWPLASRIFPDLALIRFGSHPCSHSATKSSCRNDRQRYLLYPAR